MKRILVALVVACALYPSPAYVRSLSPEAINAAGWSKLPPKQKRFSATALKAQVLLDRAGFSPGAIDGRGGENFEKALAAFQKHAGLNETRTLDEATWAKLVEGSETPTVAVYTITKRDVKGPFVKRIPKDFVKMAELERLNYKTPKELLAEKFHMSEQLLSALNKGKPFTKAGIDILVANVGADAPENGSEAKNADKNTGKRVASLRNTEGSAQRSKRSKVSRVEVRKGERTLRAFAEDGSLLAFFPASVGSDEKPAPTGNFEVRAVAENPTYRYNPDYKFKGQKSLEPVEIAAGPNNPVGAIWIALSAEGYGIHGTPEPEKVSKTSSNGCIRLTNWDAQTLARMVKRGTSVDIID